MQNGNCGIWRGPFTFLPRGHAGRKPEAARLRETEALQRLRSVGRHCSLFKEFVMRFFFVLLAALSFVWAGNAQAWDMKEATAKIKNPMTIEATGGNPYFNVVFNHKTHARMSCRICHHEEGSDGYYVPCSECHDGAGAHEKDPMSAFQAYHYTGKSGSGTSCLGCHKKLLEENPEKFAAFRGCRPCHASTAGRQQIKLDLTADVAKREAARLESEAMDAAAALEAAQARASDARTKADAAKAKAQADVKAAADNRSRKAKADEAAALAKDEPKAAPAAGMKPAKDAAPKTEAAAPKAGMEPAAAGAPKAQKAAPAAEARPAPADKAGKEAPAAGMKNDRQTKPEQKPMNEKQQMQKDVKKAKAPAHNDTQGK